MKHIAGAVVIFFLALFFYTKFAGPIPFTVSSVVTTKTDTFTATGEGKATVIPDIAIVNAGVASQGATVKLVQQELNTKINAVSAAVKALNIDSKDIQTTNYSISPIYDYRDSGQKITGYQSNADMVIKIRDMDRANEVIDAATAAGANQVGGVSFDVSDKSKAQSEARNKAVSDAKKKAGEAADAAGFSLGRIINYSENFGGDLPRPMYAKVAIESAPADDATHIEPGSSEIIVTVALSYEIR